MVNHYYLYAVYDEFGLFFIKFCSCLPYNAKLCLNGHEYVKRQLARPSLIPIPKWMAGNSGQGGTFPAFAEAECTGRAADLSGRLAR